MKKNHNKRLRPKESIRNKSSMNVSIGDSNYIVSYSNENNPISFTGLVDKNTGQLNYFDVDVNNGNINQTYDFTNTNERIDFFNTLDGNIEISEVLRNLNNNLNKQSESIQIKNKTASTIEESNIKELNEQWKKEKQEEFANREQQIKNEFSDLNQYDAEKISDSNYDSKIDAELLKNDILDPYEWDTSNLDVADSPFDSTVKNIVEETADNVIENTAETIIENTVETVAKNVVKEGAEKVVKEVTGLNVELNKSKNKPKKKKKKKTKNKKHKTKQKKAKEITKQNKIKIEQNADRKIIDELDNNIFLSKLTDEELLEDLNLENNSHNADYIKQKRTDIRNKYEQQKKQQRQDYLNSQQGQLDNANFAINDAQKAIDNNFEYGQTLNYTRMNPNTGQPTNLNPQFNFPDEPPEGYYVDDIVGIDKADNNRLIKGEELVELPEGVHGPLEKKKTRRLVGGPDTDNMATKAIKGLKDLSVMELGMSAFNVLGAVGDYKDARRKGHGVVSSAVRAGAKFALDEAMGFYALPFYLIKDTPKYAIQGADMLYKENRRMNSAANNQTFGTAQFADNQQLATMRASGMEMAKMAQYNLQQTLLGNEATYLHR